ncbi:MAG: DUF1893 domain-containing protein [Candidatus Izimaplasma sp.]|nr:DUF1893 domain-containing protein [Candidatus Izimaplasma bacterium]
MNQFLKELKQSKELTCLIVKNTTILFKSTAKGVKPLMDYYQSPDKQKDVIVYDKIMGRGAVILSVLINAKKIVTPIISDSALKLAKHHNLEVFYEQNVPYIINRNNDGRCPIETSVLNIKNPQHGYEVILETLKKLKEAQKHGLQKT